MITDHISHYDLYKGKDERVDRAINYIQTHDFKGIPAGINGVDGDVIFFNHIEYETKPAEERFWESHKKYIDIHYILEGKEYVGYELFERMQIKQDYHEQDDYFLLEGPVKSKIKLEKGDFMICYPDDAHMTGIKVDSPEKVRKVVFKVLI